MHEADQPDAVVDLLDAEPELTLEIGAPQLIGREGLGKCLQRLATTSIDCEEKRDPRQDATNRMP